MSKVTDPVHALPLGVADAHHDVTRVNSPTSQMNVGYRVVIQFALENLSEVIVKPFALVGVFSQE